MRSNLAVSFVRSFARTAFAALAASAFAAPNAYIGNYSDNTVSVIDVATRAVTQTIPVGVAPTGVAVSPDGSRVYVANYYSNDVSVIDTATNAVIATIPVAGTSYGVVVSPDGSHVYVANHHADSISVISTASNTVMATIPLSINPFQLAITRDGSTVYAGCQGFCNQVAMISTATNTVTGYATVPGFPNTQVDMDTTPDGSKLYVSSNSGNNMSVLGAATGALIATIPVGDTTGGLVVSPAGDKVYAGTGAGNVVVVSTTTGEVLATIPVAAAGGFPGSGKLRGMSLTSDGAQLYVVDWDDNSVFVIDTASNAVATVTVGTNPYSFGKFIQKTLYTFTGFFSPVNNPPTFNQMNAGKAVPVRFSLGGDKGLDIMAENAPSSHQIACDSLIAMDVVEETVTAGASSLQYDTSTSQYTYVWKTQKEWSNTCRQFDLRLKDGSSHSAVFQFVR